MIRFANVRPALLILTLAATVAMGAAPAAAQIEGDNINVAMGFAPGTLFFTPGTSAVVGPGAEFTLEQPSTPLFTFNFTFNTLVITAIAPNAISVSSPIIFSDIDWPANPSAFISAAFVQPGSAVVTQGGVSFTAHTLTVNLCCGFWQPGATASIELYPESGLVATTTESWGAIKSLYR